MSRYARPRWVGSAVLVCAALAMTSCGGSSHKAAPAGGGATLVGKARSVSLGSLTPQQIGAAQTAFGLDLLAQRCTAQPHANDVLSPASAAIALSMLDAGARGSTGAACRTCCTCRPGVRTSSQRCTGSSSRSRAQAAPGEQPALLPGRHQAAAAGARRSRDRVRRRPANAGLCPHAAEATDAINKHVDTDTHGLIPKLFDNPLDPETTTVLTNALVPRREMGGAFHTAATALSAPRRARPSPRR